MSACRSKKFLDGVATGELPPGKMLVGELLWSRAELERCLDTSSAAMAGAPDRDPLFDPVAAAIEAMEAHTC